MQKKKNHPVATLLLLRHLNFPVNMERERTFREMERERKNSEDGKREKIERDGKGKIERQRERENGRKKDPRNQ